MSLNVQREISECSLKQITTNFAESKDNTEVLSSAVCRSPCTVESRFRYQATPLGFVVVRQALGQACFECYSFPCHCHSTDALYLLSHLIPTLKTNTWVVFIWCLLDRGSLWQRKNKNQLDATYYFIVLLKDSTCFGHYYAHNQELATIMLITALIVSFLVCCRLEVRCG